MNTYDDSLLIEEIINNNDSDALIELSERHSGIYYDIVKKYIPISTNKTYLDDFNNRKIEIVYDAVCSFKKEKGVKFVTWFANLTRYTCLSERTKLSKQPDFYEFSEEMGGSTSLCPYDYFSLKDEAEKILKKIENKFGKRQCDIFSEIYFGGRKRTGNTLAQVAKNYKITPQAVQATHKKILKFLKNEITT